MGATLGDPATGRTAAGGRCGKGAVATAGVGVATVAAVTPMATVAAATPWPVMAAICRPTS